MNRKQNTKKVDFAAKRKASARSESAKQKLSFFQNFFRSSSNNSDSRSGKSAKPAKFRGKEENKEDSHHQKRVDPFIVVCVAILVAVGWMMVYSSSFYVASQRASTLFAPNNSFHFFIIQGVAIVVGLIACFVCVKMKFSHLRALALPGLIIVGMLLIAVLFLNKEINGARLWIKLGPFSLQPSELAKPLLCLYYGYILSKDWKSTAENLQTKLVDYLTQKFLPFALVLVPIMGLVFIGKDLAGAAIIGVIGVAMYFLSSNSKIHNWFTGLLASGGVLMGVLFAVIEPYRLQRIKTYLGFLGTGVIEDPLNTGYQLQQTLIAVGTGGILGYGFGQSLQKYFYLQETAFSDTIFAVYAEEFGLLGSLALITVFLLLFLRGIKIAQAASNKASALTAFGLVIWLFLQTAIHLGVNVGLIPLTGVTLPFMSYGGSAMISSLIGVGLLLNISKQAKLDYANK